MWLQGGAFFNPDTSQAPEGHFEEWLHTRHHLHNKNIQACWFHPFFLVQSPKQCLGYFTVNWSHIPCLITLSLISMDPFLFCATHEFDTLLAFWNAFSWPTTTNNIHYGWPWGCTWMAFAGGRVVIMIWALSTTFFMKKCTHRYPPPLFGVWRVDLWPHLILLCTGTMNSVNNDKVGWCDGPKITMFIPGDMCKIWVFSHKPGRITKSSKVLLRRH